MRRAICIVYEQKALFHLTLIKCNYIHLCLYYIRTEGQLLICTFALLNYNENRIQRQKEGEGGRRKRETQILLNSSPCTWGILMTYLTNKYINQFNTYFKIAYVIWHPTYRTNAKSQLPGHLLSLTPHSLKIFYFPWRTFQGVRLAFIRQWSMGLPQ